MVVAVAAAVVVVAAAVVVAVMAMTVAAVSPSSWEPYRPHKNNLYNQDQPQATFRRARKRKRLWLENISNKSHSCLPWNPHPCE